VPAHSLPAPILQGGGEQFASRLDALQPGAVFNRQRQGIAQAGIKGKTRTTWRYFEKLSYR